MTTAEELIDELLEFKRMPAAQRAKMARSRKKPKTGQQKMVLKSRRKAAKKPASKTKAKRYRQKTKAFRH